MFSHLIVILTDGDWTWISDVCWTEVILRRQSSVLDQLDGDLGGGGTLHVQPLPVTRPAPPGVQAGGQLSQRVQPGDLTTGDTLLAAPLSGHTKY